VTTARLIYLLLMALPDIIRLLKRLDELENNQEVKDDLREIDEAFRTRDPDRLKRVFEPPKA
jgi:hypothetical protein